MLDRRSIKEALGLSRELRVHATDCEASQAVEAAVLADGAEGLPVPSVTRLGINLILLPANMPAGSLTSRSSRSEIPGSTSSANG